MPTHDEVQLHEELTGQVALVTGANRGIGQEIAAKLTELGATVHAGARDPATVTAEDQHAVRLDVTDQEQVQQAVDQVVATSGRLDILVNNAGIIGPKGPLASCPLDKIRGTLATNLQGPMAVSRACLPHLIEHRGARIVNVSSGAGSFEEGLMTSRTPYAVSKAGLNALTVCLARTYAGQGLLVNAVCPGWVATDMGGREAPRSPAKGAQTPVWLARFQPDAPTGRFWRDKRPIPW